MTRKIHLIYASLLGLVLFSFPTFSMAQPAAPSSDAQARSRHTLRIALADNGSTLRELVVQSGEKSFQPANVTPFQISEPLILKAKPEQLSFFIKGVESAEAVLASVAVPDGFKHMLIVLAPKNDQRAPSHQAFLINEADFPDQSIWFLNGSGKPVVIQIADAKHSLAAEAAKLVRPENKSGEPLGVQAFFSEKNKWRIFSSTRWVLPQGQRHLVFFQVNPRTQRMDYNSLTDFITE